MRLEAAQSRDDLGESDRQLELDCSHMGFGVSGRAFPQIIKALRDF